jgi:hypothetical protein
MFAREGKTNINDIFIHMLTKYGIPQDVNVLLLLVVMLIKIDKV